jgi:hypothetical protein
MVAVVALVWFMVTEAYGPVPNTPVLAMFRSKVNVSAFAIEPKPSVITANTASEIANLRKFNGDIKNSFCSRGDT